MHRLGLVAVSVAAACAARPLDVSLTAPDAAADPQTGLPLDLFDTGLYKGNDVDPANRAYTPAFTLWSDGVEKSRWIHLPPGTQIDVSDMNEWRFPVGTKIWKEFRADFGRIETRLLWKKDDTTWEMGTYVWSADQKSATLHTAYDPVPVPFPGTTDYEVPVARCEVCHDGRADRVLGFEAALLAAPEADQNGLTWDKLVAEGLVTAGAPSLAEAQFLPSASATERQAVAYLHVNCGIACHNATAKEKTPFYARLEWPMPVAIEDTQVFKTAINVPSQFVPSQGNGPFYRIRPTDRARSMIYYRMSVRNGLVGGGEQMPPIDSHHVDDMGLLLIGTWIDGMTAAPYPAPAP